VLQEISLIRELLEKCSPWTSSKKRSWPMSKVSESASNDLLNKLSLAWVDGNTLHEIIPPDNAPVIPLE